MEILLVVSELRSRKMHMANMTVPQSDPECDKAASSLCVRTGSVNDPEDIPGLSHLLEHM